MLTKGIKESISWGKHEDEKLLMIHPLYIEL